MSNDFHKWSEERIALLTRLWAEELSASRIAAELGGVTRNAVISKVHRLGLPKRRTAPAPNNGRQTAPERPKPREAERRQLKIVRRPETAIGSAAGVTLAELEDHMCRWPYGDPKTPGFRFCGRTKAGELSYCAQHARIAYTPSGIVYNTGLMAERLTARILNTEKSKEQIAKMADKLREVKY